MKILVIGATGMLGGSLLRYFADKTEHDVYGTVRDSNAESRLVSKANANIICGIDVHNVNKIRSIIEEVRPDYVINCVGVVKQLKESKYPIHSITINSLLPHRLAEICSHNNSKLIHFSTDCVFSGNRGNYSVNDVPDAFDLYGRSKLLGEVSYAPHLTLRTSIIGHEQGSQHSLIDWFLNQSGEVKGFTKAVFSGVPTVYMAELLNNYVFTNPDITGLYQVSVEPIDKYSLLSLVKDIYGKDIDINADDSLVIDRSLNSTEFKIRTGMNNPSWKDLIEKMYNEYRTYFQKA
ncbi:SDR family oxidoreductase [Escherichia albertii]|uniref:dTDP-4-dehydrorhamnose reductase n=2 Tax=Enterobacteriaceae TaxID=543 RepID=A0A5A4U8A6_ESCAL|nr:SDR family oxidoreductase [Escherichia albertii]AAR24275.1 L-QuiNAc synthase [Shigella boydii]EFG1229161.1 SDR family oxidoreductase [Escherichia albertii]EFZ2303319.1 SDR family oxidoreductase [Shigella boydii]EFZ6210953.1 SDR family oxidoreductase [Shigella boydii]EFZ6297623.1 SDR family oxidoreductase [Shigella boydii]